MDISTTDMIITMLASRELARVLSNGTASIDWVAVEAEASDPKGWNRAWAKMLLCARESTTCDKPYEQ